ncbi:MAG: hypothetical protein N2517_03815 [Ignavibacteria bacterium]|nr:hypothetical protein [Ignavibacteria bacterium]
MKILFTQLLFFLLLYSNIFGSDFKRNVLYFQLFGEGIGVSLNGETRLHSNAVLRIGLSWFVVASGIPVSLSYISGVNSSHHLELGLGFNFADVSAVKRLLDPENTLDIPNQIVIPFGIVGYRLQPKNGGFVFRASFTPLIIDWRKFFPYAGLSFGYCF